MDTKYEFGRSSDGSILLIDEVSFNTSSFFPYHLSFECTVYSNHLLVHIVYRFIRRMQADTGLLVPMKSASRKVLSLKMLIRSVIFLVFSPWPYSSSQVLLVQSALLITCLPSFFNLNRSL